DACDRIWGVLLSAATHSDNCLPRVLRLVFDNMNALADRILTRPELVGHVFIDDNRNWRSRVVLLVEESSAPQGYSHGLEIVAANEPLIGVEEFFTGKGRSAFDSDWCPGKSFAERQ